MTASVLDRPLSEDELLLKLMRPASCEGLVLPGLVVDNEVVDVAVDQPGPPPLHQDVPGPGAVD